MNQRRIDYYNKLIGKEEDKIKKFRRNKKKRVHRRIDYYEDILKRLEEKKIEDYEILLIN